MGMPDNCLAAFVRLPCAWVLKADPEHRVTDPPRYVCIYIYVPIYNADHGRQLGKSSRSSASEGASAHLLVLSPHACQVPGCGGPFRPSPSALFRSACLHPLPSPRQMLAWPRLPPGAQASHRLVCRCPRPRRYCCDGGCCWPQQP